MNRAQAFSYDATRGVQCFDSAQFIGVMKAQEKSERKERDFRGVVPRNGTFLRKVLECVRTRGPIGSQGVAKVTRCSVRGACCALFDLWKRELITRSLTEPYLYEL